MKYLILISVIFFFIGCKEADKREAEIEKTPVSVKIDRFDIAFANTDASGLQELKNKYPAFFPKQFKDSLWLSKMQDTLQNQLEAEVQKQFPDNDALEDVLTPLFKHIKYYFPQTTIPTVVTLTSDVDYQNKVILADSLLLLSLDTYLGSNHEFYEGISAYVAKEMRPDQIGPDVAEVYARKLVRAPNKSNLLAQMVYFGKKLYLNDIWLPNETDAIKIGYTEEEMTWANENESYMWRYFVEKELLYSTNPKLSERFMNPAPFSKFYLEIDNESPGMTGRYLGLQIIRSFMKNNDVSVQQLMVIDADEIFNKSKYKPKK